MEKIGIAGIILIILNTIISYKGFKNSAFLRKYAFQIDEILVHKDYKRMITSGFLHVNWIHFGFNMASLYFFSYCIESTVGIFSFLLIYFGSLIGGNLLALFIHRKHGDYSAVGASGAISGVILGAVALFKNMEVGLLFTTFGIPGWLYGLVFIIISIYGIKSQNNSIGHEAHLGGGIIGLLIAIALVPGVTAQNPIPIILVFVPSLIFLSIIFIKPDFLAVKKLLSEKPEGLLDVDDRYNIDKVTKEEELNALLDKIHNKGIHRLSKIEKERLEELSK
ncbi:hypothetical protein GCM10022393_30970 [Aquimarina addita]|uniref:Rhomboid family intramembrane serine protease n=1 Tax=Aquimarina addita TaxID=870485 RepID=A0ABP6UP28_9FLAO